MKNKFIRIGSALLAFVLAFVLLAPQLPLADAATTENGQTVYNLGDFAGQYVTYIDADSSFTYASFGVGGFPLTSTLTNDATGSPGKHYFTRFELTDMVITPKSPDDLRFELYYFFPSNFDLSRYISICFNNSLGTRISYNNGVLDIYNRSSPYVTISSSYEVFELLYSQDRIVGLHLVSNFLTSESVISSIGLPITFSSLYEYSGTYTTTYTSFDSLIIKVGTPTDPDPEPSTPTTPGITLLNNPDSNGVFTVFEGESFTQSIDITNVNGTPSANIVIGGTSYPMTISPGSNGTTYRATYTGSAGPPGTQQLSYEVFNELNGETASAVSDNYTLQSFVVPTVPTINVVGGETTTWDVILGQAVDFSVFGEGVNANGLVGLYVNGQLIADKVAALEYGVSSWSHTFQFTPEAVGDYEIYAVIDNNSGGLNNGRTESAQSQVITLHVVEASALPDWLVELKNWLASQFADNRAWMETWFQALSEDIQAVVQAVKDLGGGIASIPGNVTDAVEEVTGKVDEITGKLEGVAGREDELVGDANDKLDNLPPEIGVTPVDPVTGDNVDYTVVENNVVLTQIFDFAPVKGMLMVYSAFLVINAVFLGKWWGTRKEKG